MSKIQRLILLVALVSMYPFWYGCKYQLGFPAGDVDSEPDVLFQVTMDEGASNELIDVAQGITLSEVGSPEYGKVPTGGGVYGLLKPGISYPANSGHSGTFTDEFDLAAGTPITLEGWVQGTSFYDSTEVLFLASDNSDVLDCSVWLLLTEEGYRSGLPCLTFWVVNDDGLFGGGGAYFELLQSEFDFADNKPHHIRAVYDPTDATSSFIAADGEVKVTGDMTVVGGAGMTEWNTVEVGAVSTNPGITFLSDAFEIRMSANATNNSYQCK